MLQYFMSGSNIFGAIQGQTLEIIPDILQGSFDKNIPLVFVYNFALAVKLIAKKYIRNTYRI